MRIFLLPLLFLGLALPVQAETVASVESPGKVLTVEVDLSGGEIGYRVLRAGKPVINTSHLGFRFQELEQMRGNFVFTSKRVSSFDETWEQPWGERRFVRNHYNEVRARFTEPNRGKRVLDVVFRVYDDGIGFRYEFPDQAQFKDVKILDELTEFDVAEPALAWWTPAGEPESYEMLVRRTPLAEVGQAHTPMTVRTRSGLHLSFHEAALVDYSAMWLRHVGGQKFRAELSPSSEGWKVRRAAPFHTPWRTIQISDRAGGLVESSLILNLNEPNKLGDTSWFKPHKYVGVWWGMHLDTESWRTGPKHGATTANTKRYIDFAARHGFRGVLVEGWNVGWDGDWAGNGWGFDFTKPTPDFDIEALAAYAKSKGVRLIGHHETGCAVSHYERQLEDALSMYARLGVDSVKTGYVCEDGQIERQDKPNGLVVREWHDGQWQVRHLLKVVEEAAKHKIAVNSHEPVKDTGLRRTYPNWVSREGARGQEYNAWGVPPNPPDHEPNMVFTRMLSGPMDFTPGVMSLRGKGGLVIQNTKARQLAYYVVLYSPIQMAADLPENYEKHMDGFQFIKDVPADWQDTRVVNGEIGEFVTIARKDRNSEDWYVGSITNGDARTVKVPLSFLDAKRSYTAQIYRDGEGADWKTNPFAFVREERQVKRGDTLTLKLGSGGGAAIRFVAR